VFLAANPTRAGRLYAAKPERAAGDLARWEYPRRYHAKLDRFVINEAVLGQPGMRSKAVAKSWNPGRKPLAYPPSVFGSGSKHNGRLRDCRPIDSSIVRRLAAPARGGQWVGNTRRRAGVYKVLRHQTTEQAQFEAVHLMASPQLAGAIGYIVRGGDLGAPIRTGSRTRRRQTDIGRR
jgi:hypothetical protein